MLGDFIVTTPFNILNSNSQNVDKRSSMIPTNGWDYPDYFYYIEWTTAPWGQRYSGEKTTHQKHFIICQSNTPLSKDHHSMKTIVRTSRAAFADIQSLLTGYTILYFFVG